MLDWIRVILCCVGIYWINGTFKIIWDYIMIAYAVNTYFMLDFSFWSVLCTSLTTRIGTVSKAAGIMPLADLINYIISPFNICIRHSATDNHNKCAKCCLFSCCCFCIPYEKFIQKLNLSGLVLNWISASSFCFEAPKVYY